MSYLNGIFFVFFPIFFVLYNLTPRTKRYLILWVGSWVFYGYSDFHMLIMLIAITSIVYFSGVFIAKTESRFAYIISYLTIIIVLLVFKYSNFMISGFNFLTNGYYSINGISIVLPIGLSFIVFQSCNYLNDVYHNRIKAEYNYAKVSCFIAFFPTVLSGPIQKARILLPQINEPSEFDYDQGIKGVLLFLWGMFEKLVVANRLSAVYTAVMSSYADHSSAQVLLAAICFSIYIYADFSAYSDMARGVAKLLGIDVGKNFLNPYLSGSIAEFWNRWHITLYEWFKENVYYPLGGNRKGKIRKYFNILVIFFLSGLWHGASLHFVVWGMLNGVLVVLEQVFHTLGLRFFSGSNDEVEGIIFLKRAYVFVIITITWIFFSNGIVDSINICKRLFRFDFLSLFDPNLLSIFDTQTNLLLMAFSVVIFVTIQLKRQDEKRIYNIYSRQPLIIQCLSVAILVCICIFNAFAIESYVNMNFLYFEF